MPRITQRSLKISDERGNELPVVPSHEIHEVLIELSNEYVDRILENVEIDKEEVGKLRCYFAEIFEYGNVEDKIIEAERILKNISGTVDLLDEGKKKECEGILTHLTHLVSNQLGSGKNYHSTLVT